MRNLYGRPDGPINLYKSSPFIDRALANVDDGFELLDLYEMRAAGCSDRTAVNWATLDSCRSVIVNRYF